MNKVFCSKCGAQVGPNERFCQKCGTLVADFSQVPLQPAQQMPQQSMWQAQQPGFIVPPQGKRQASTPLQVPSTLREPIPPQHAAAIAQPLPVSSHNVTIAQPLPEPITANNNPPVYNSQHQYNNFFSQGHPEQQFVVQGNQGTADQSGSFNASNDVRFKDRQLPDKSKAVAIVLWIFLSFFQIHAFYLRMKKAAIIKLAALVLIIAIIIGGGAGLYGNSSINTVFTVLLVALFFLIVIWNLVDLIRIVAKPKYHFRGAWQYVPQEATTATGVPEIMISKYEDIMRDITNGLTGEPEADMKHLMDKSEEYKSHELAKEILRGIGRLFYEIISPEVRAELNTLADNNHLRVKTVIEETEFQMYKKNYERALEIIETMVKESEGKNGERTIFADDSVNEYHFFQNLFEEVLYKELFKPERSVRRMSDDYAHLYFVYGNLLFELKLCDDARNALKKAIQINPVCAEAILELAEINKLHGEWDEYINLTKQCLKVAYTGRHVGRCYRNLGYYYTEQKNYDLAVALYIVSIEYDKESTKPQSQLFYIQQVSNKPIPALSYETSRKLLEKNDIQAEANRDVLELAYGLGKLMAEKDDNDTARFLFSIVYDLTHDDKIKGIHDSLPE
jgi:tetratricopeptide (TPR) repeat protein